MPGIIQGQKMKPKTTTSSLGALCDPAVQVYRKVKGQIDLPNNQQDGYYSKQSKRRYSNKLQSEDKSARY